MAYPRTPRRGDPENIERFVAGIRDLLFMVSESDLRIGQTIHNVLGMDFYNTEDVELIDRLRSKTAELAAWMDAMEEGEVDAGHPHE